MNIGKRLGVVAALLALTATGLAGDRIQILRDVHGVAHVTARTDTAALYGAGWVSAADRLYQMHRVRRTAQGRLSELIGLVQTPSTSTLEQDIAFRQRRFYEHCQTVAARLDARTLSLLEAYCDGVNAYIEAHAHDLHPLFEGEVPEPWTPADCLAAWDRVAEYFGVPIPKAEPAKRHAIDAAGSCESYINQNPNHLVVDESAAVVRLDDLSQGEAEALCAFAESKGYPCDFSSKATSPLASTRPPHVTDVDYPKFSNAWVVGGSALADGAVALLSDPQTSITAPSIWHEMHVTGASFDVRGIMIPGCPGFLIGTNQQVAWGVTALGIDLADTFRLTLDAEGTEYLFDGEWFPIHSRTETIVVKTLLGFDTEPVEVRWTHLGPIVTDLLNGVTPGEEYVLRAVPLVDTDRHTVQATLAMMSARTTDDIVEALRSWRTPALNFVFGDTRGAIGYQVAAAVPVRSPDTCLGGTAAQDGSLSAAGWRGFIPPELLPHVRLPQGGALFSANHLPVGTWYPIPLHLGQGGAGDGARSWRLRERLTAVQDGVTDLTSARVLAVREDDVNPIRREIVRAAMFLANQQPEMFSADAHAALDLLGPWLEAGARSSLGEPGFALAWKLDTKFRQHDWPTLVAEWGGNNIVYFLKDIQRRLDTVAEVGADGPVAFSITEVDFFDNALTEAWQETNQAYGSDPELWTAALVEDVGRLEAGYFSTLEGFGSMDPDLDVEVTGLTNPDNSTLGSQRKQSFSLFARPDAQHQSRALHPIGEVDDHRSAFFDHEAAPLVEGTLRSAALRVPPHEVYSVTWLERDATTLPQGGRRPSRP